MTFPFLLTCSSSKLFERFF